MGSVVWTVFVSAIILNSISAQLLFPTETTPPVVEAQSFGDCNTPRQERGQCIYLQSCAPLYQLLTKNPLADEDRNYLKRSQCGYNDGTVLVCCPAVQTVASRGSGAAGNKLPQPGTCGTGSTDRIYGGNKTRIDEFPWMALLEYSKPGNNRGFHCGGVLINNRYVLTASHCVNGKAIPSDWRLSSVRLGEWDTSTANDCDQDDCSDPPVDVTIEQFITHENYNPNLKSQLNDIALLRLSRSIPYTDWIKPICLPTATHLRTAAFVGSSLDVSGWGRTENASRSNIKLKARVDGVALNSCNEVYKRHGVTLQNTQICAGGVSGIDSCQGDSGGPLVGIDKTSRIPYFFLVGIVSFGPTPCALSDWPGVYTKASSYIDWIERNIRP